MGQIFDALDPDSAESATFRLGPQSGPPDRKSLTATPCGRPVRPALDTRC